jgi:hypothetical protein
MGTTMTKEERSHSLYKARAWAAASVVGGLGAYYYADYRIPLAVGTAFALYQVFGQIFMTDIGLREVYFGIGNK